MKRVLFFLVLAFSLASLSCIRHKDEAIRVSLFTDADTLHIMRDHLRDFEKESGLKAESVYIPYANYSDKLLTQISAGQAPDVIWVDVTLFPSLQANGAFQPLNRLMKKDPVDMSQFYPDVVRRFSRGKQVYAIPQDTAPIACVFYNKRLFREAQIPYPKNDWNWDEFLSVCKKLTKKDKRGKVTQWAFMDNYGPDAAGAIYSNGGKYVDNVLKPTRCLLDSPAAIEAVQFLSDLMNKYEVSPPMSARSSMLSLGQDELIKGRVAMVRCGIWITPSLRLAKDLDWDIVPFPSGPRVRRGKGGWNTGGSGYALATGSKHPENAWKLIKYLSSARSEMAYAKLGFVQPAIMSLASSDVFVKSAPPENKRWLLDAVGRSVYSPYHPRWNEAETAIISNELTAVWIGQVKPAVAMKSIAARVNKLLFRGKK